MDAPKTLPQSKFDLSLYYVTSAEPFPSQDAFLMHLEEALSSEAITIVQLREKKLPTEDFTALGKRVHEITKKKGIPLVINDNVEVCKKVGAEGLHIGWKDTDYASARAALPENVFIGISASNIQQATACIDLGCDYIGLGPVFPTTTKLDANPVLYPTGAREVLEHIASQAKPLPVVAIGGINAENVQALRYIATPVDTVNVLRGVAVVSAISAAPNPAEAAKELSSLWKSEPLFVLPTIPNHPRTVEAVLKPAAETIAAIAAKKPLIQHMTNTVVQTLTANIALASGASPIMSRAESEIVDLSKVNSGLVLNIGTLDESIGDLYVKAVRASNKTGVKVVFDPVGAGASTLRKETCKKVLNSGYISVIKGNESELRTLAGVSSGTQKGVDSGEAGTESARIEVAKGLAQKYKNIVVMTGKVDVVTDGTTTYLLSNGHFFQGLTTGVGCSLSSVIAAAVSVGEDALGATVAAVSLYNITAEIAALHRDEVKGPGTFVPYWIDEIYRASQASVQGVLGWVGFAKVRREGEEFRGKGSSEVIR